MNTLVKFPRTRSATLSDSKAEAAVNVTDLRFSWRDTHEAILEIEYLEIRHGERIFIMGPSGSGKSTLLSLLAGIVTPQLGNITIMDRQVSSLSGIKRDRFRADHIGFIFQMFNLIPYLSVIENVTLPCRFSARRKKKVLQKGATMEEEAVRLLSHVDMAETKLLKRPVIELSVGQQQRVAAARALIGSPEVLIADEPTSSLDAGQSLVFIQLLFQECSRENTTLVFVSHDASLARLFDRTVMLAEVNRADRSPRHGTRG